MLTVVPVGIVNFFTICKIKTWKSQINKHLTLLKEEINVSTYLIIGRKFVFLSHQVSYLFDDIFLQLNNVTIFQEAEHINKNTRFEFSYENPHNLQLYRLT